MLTPRLLDRLETAFGLAVRPVASLGVLGMLAIAGVTVVDVLLRWFANTGIEALNEIMAVLFTVAVAACIPSGLARRVNVTVDILERWLPPVLARWLAAAGAVLLCLFFALLSWQIAVYAAALAEQGRTTVILEWPLAPFIHVTAALLGIGACLQAVIAANAVRKAIEFAPSEPSRAVAWSDWLAAAMVAGVTLLVVAVAALAVSDFAALASWTQQNAGTAIVIALAVMWAGLLMMIPLAAAMGLIGLVASALFIGFAPSFTVFATESVGFMMKSEAATVPLFLMMGGFAVVAGVSDDIYRVGELLFGRFRGGLAMATVGGCAGFGAVTGSSVATVATFGRISLPEMRARGYSDALASGCVAAGGTLGALIPPSGILIIFALLTEASIGQLFVAAVIPGLLTVAFYLLAIWVYVRWTPDSVPAPTRNAARELMAALRGCGAVFLLLIAVLGGIFTGVVTTTEAAAVGAFGTFLVALFRGRLGRGALWQVMEEVTATTAMIYGLIFGALMFSYFVAVTALPERSVALIGGLDVGPVVIILVFLAVYLVLGSVMDSVAIMIVTVPILTPLILHLGYDIVWWGIISVAIVELGMITPPFGINVFVLKATAPDIPLATVFRGVLVFCAADILKILLLVALPVLSLWLPSIMF